MTSGLVVRREGTEAAANIAFVEARARLAPGVGAAYIRVAGVSAIFDGPDSPLNRMVLWAWLAYVKGR